MAIRNSHSRTIRERKTVEAMIRIYCSEQHGPAVVPCERCEDLLRYAERRLKMCPFGADKPTCATCPIHCYRPAKREEIRAVMRYAGPRMLYRHPILAVRHLMDGWRKHASRSGEKGRGGK